MALFDLYDLSANVVVAHPKPPTYPDAIAPESQVVLARTLGGVMRSEMRGPDLRRFALTWERVTAAHYAAILAFLARFGGGRAACRVELPADMTDLSAGALLPVRCLDTRPRAAWIGHGRFSFSLEFQEDLGAGLVLFGFVALAATTIVTTPGSAGIQMAGVDLTAVDDGTHYLVLTDSAARRLSGWLKAPSGSATSVVSTRSGSIYNWSIIDPNFDAADEVGYRYSVSSY